MAKQERQYLTAVTICAGIITLINQDGSIGYYRQRGISRLSDQQRHILISNGLLHRNWEGFKELPSNISISYEDPELMGRARASYPNPEEIVKALQNSKITKK
jgi:hypothetical protein